MHTFRPSPFLKDNFLTQDPDDSCSVVLEDNFIITQDGFPSPSRRVKIVGEELGYNKNSESFRILLLDGPLIGEPQAVVEADDRVPNTDSIWTLEKSRDFLAGFPECMEAAKTLDVELKRFQSTYIVLAGYLDDAASKLQRIWTDVTDMFLSSLRKSLVTDAATTERIRIAVECCVVGTVFDTTWSAVCQHCASDDVRLGDKCRQLQNVRPSQLFLPVALESCDLSSATTLLETLDSCMCPREKLVCMKSVLDAITDAVSTHLVSHPNSQSTVKICLTSDDYISLLVLVIVRHRGRHLPSNIHFLDTFLLYTKHSDNLSFSLVTFKAACKFILSLPVGQLRQLTDDSTIAKMEQPVCQPDAGEEPKEHKSRLDWELDRINWMLATTARITSPTADIPTSAPLSSTSTEPTDTPVVSWSAERTNKTRQVTSPLGDFLSSLKKDSLHTSFGKQN